jgi:hypothetical protein
MIAGGDEEKENVMKVVGIGTELKLGKVLKILNGSVLVDCQGKKVNVAFSQVESEVFGG